MQWIKTILEKHISEDGVLDLAAVETELNAQAPMNVIPKDQYNSKVNELKEAQDTLDDLKKNHKDVEALQTSIKEYETKVEELEQEKKDQAKEFALKSALTSVGAVDVDYFTDKLKADVELDEEGNLTGFDEKIKDYQTKHPKLFALADEKQEKDKNKNGFNVLDNKLDGGDASPGMTKESIMAIEDTTERQKAIKENLKLFT